MGLAYVLCKWDKPMCSENGTIQCALRMGLANVHWEGDYQICSVNGTIMEYGSTPYVGMALEKNGFSIKFVQNDMLRTLL